MTRQNGRALRGERVVVQQPGRKFKRVNVVAGWHSNDKKILAPTTYSWNTNATWFLIWFEFFLCPLLKPGTIIVLDNARFHNKEGNYGNCQILWLCCSLVTKVFAGP